MAAPHELAIILTATDQASSVIGKAGDAITSFATGPVGIAAAGAATVGAALFKIGSDFDGAYDTIQSVTGKTGDQMEALKESFKNVAKDTPADFGVISSVLGQLSQRTGLTGKDLEGLSQQVLDLGRVTGGDPAQSVASITRLMGDWSISGDKASGALDEIFRASQATGIGTDALMDKMVQFGAPLRQFGFSFEDATGLMGKWEKEGVNSELVLGSLRIAMGKFAKDNVPLKQGLADTIAEIQKMGPGAAATSKAMEIFGARAGPDMAAAILEGRFALGDLTKQIKEGGSTIKGTADDTADAAEKFKVMLNKLEVAFEPVASQVFNLVGELADALMPAIEELAPVVGELAKLLGSILVPAIKDGLVPAIRLVAGPLKWLLEQFAGLVKGVKDIFGIHSPSSVFADIGAAIVQGLGAGLTGVFKAIFPGVLLGPLGAALQLALKALGLWPKDVGSALSGVGGAISGAFDSARGVGDKLEEALSGIHGAIHDLVTTGDIGVFSDDLREAFGIDISGAVSSIRSLMPTLVNAAKDLGGSIAGGIAHGLGSAATTIADAAKSAAQSALDAAKHLLGISSPSRVFADQVGKPIAQGIAQGLHGNKSLVQSALNGMVGAANLPANVGAAVGRYAGSLPKTINGYPVDYLIQQAQMLEKMGMFGGTGSPLPRAPLSGGNAGARVAPIVYQPRIFIGGRELRDVVYEGGRANAELGVRRF